MELSNLKLAIIGAGRWGMNHVRTASKILNPENISVFDFNAAVEKKLVEIAPGIKFSHNIDELLNDEKINAVIIATPAETHYKLTKKCLIHHKNVLVEKPITLYIHEAEELLKLSQKNELKLMVGHVLLYHPAVLKMKELIDKGHIGNLQYIYSNRVNLGAIRSEENILWSFAPHDISVIQFLIGSNPKSVFAKGSDFIQNGIEDITLTYLEYPGNIHAHIFVSWLHPFKEQRMVIIGEKGMFVFDDTLKTEKLKFHKKGFKVSNGNVEKFESEFEVVEYQEKMPLTEEHLHFYDSIINNEKPRTDGAHALDVLRILDSASRSLKG
jgi:UDP-2-acetamido-3-amino-2,3-dideoxy-glucuronate N-acetyltransferase